MKIKIHTIFLIGLFLSGLFLINSILTACSKGSCHVKKYTSLTASVKEWFPYEGNRPLYFVNDLSQEDTLQLTHFFSGDDDVWNGDECRMSRGEFRRGEIIDTKTNDTIKVELMFSERMYFERKKTWLHYYDTQKVLVNSSLYKRMELQLNIGGKSFEQVLILECSPVDNCKATGITKIYFAKGLGLVAYERNGITWVLK